MAEALQWPEGEKITIPRRPQAGAEFFNLIIPGDLHLPPGHADEDDTVRSKQLRDAVMRELGKHKWLEARKREVHEAALVLQGIMPEGIVEIDEQYLGELSVNPEGGLPPGIEELVTFNTGGDTEQAIEGALSACGPADAGPSEAQSTTDAGLSTMLQLASEGVADGASPQECMREACKKLQ